MMSTTGLRRLPMKSKALFERLIANWPAKILSLTAAIVFFLFNRISTLEERFFTVPIHYEIDDAYVPSSAYIKSARITLRGEGDKVFPILAEDIEVVADFLDHRAEGEFKAPLQIRKKGTALQSESLEIKVEPMEVKLQLERRLLKSLEVVPTLKGFPAQGFELGQYFLTPSSVEVEGPRSRVQNMKSISTEDIDLTGKTQDFTARVRLIQKDAYVTIRGGDVVEFKGVISDSVLLKTFERVEIVALDLDPNLTLSAPLATGLVKIQGSQFLLEKLKNQEIHLSVDCSQIRKPGKYVLQTRPEIPAGLLVLTYEPQEIAIEVYSSQ